MRSTFHGLETSKRALFTQSTALNTMGHNIANAATEGYSRQRVNMEAGRPLAFPGLQRANTPGQLGTGVVYTSVTRVRDSYLDLQFRRENQQLGMWDVHDQALKAIEKIINEPSKSGLSSVMDKFWNSLEVLNRDPQLLSARIDFIGSATNMINTLHHMNTSLDTMQADAERNIDIRLGEVNNLVNNIAQLNDTIRKTERLGDNANDYRDQRDLLLDQLSSITDMQYTEDPGGLVSVYIAGTQVVNGITATPLDQGSIASITSGHIAGYKKSIDEVNKTRDQLNGLIDTLVNGKVDITLPNGYTTSIDRIAKNDVEVDDGNGGTQTIVAGSTIPAGTKIISSVTFEVNGFNGVHELGYTMEKPSGTGLPFFTTLDGSNNFNISNIQVNPAISADTNKIAASGKYEMEVDSNNNGIMVTIRGNGDIAHALAGLRDKTFTYPSGMTSLSEGTTDDYFRAMVSELGTSANNATRNYNNQMNLVDGVNFRRSAVSGVDINEEIADMIRFQHAYNAAARNMTTIDEMLDRIINQMGIVGR